MSLKNAGSACCAIQAPSRGRKCSRTSGWANVSQPLWRGGCCRCRNNKGQGLVIHTHDCPSARRSRSDSDKWIDVEWSQSLEKSFEVRLRVSVLDQRGVLAKVAAAIAEAGSDIANISVENDGSLYATNQFTLQVSNRQHLARVMRALRRVPEVVRIARTGD